MSQQNSNTPIIIGVAAIVAIVIGVGFYFTNNMSKDSNVAEVASSVETSTTNSSSSSAEPAATPEEMDQISKTAAAAGTFDGVEVKPGNPVVAKVDGKEISRVDVFRYIKLMPEQVQQLPPTTVYPLALDQVVNTRLVQNKSDSAGLDNDPEVKQQLELARQQIVRSIFIQREVDKLISDADIKAKYDEAVGKAPAVEEVKAAHILVDSEDKAKALIEKLNAGEEFAKLAATNSGDPGNKDKGGDLGWFAKADMVPEFAEAAFKLSKGSVSSAPVKTQFGWHVIKVEDKRERPKPTLDEVKQAIQVELRRERLEALLDDWKKSASIEKFDINGDPLKEQTEVAPAAGDVSLPAETSAPVPATAE